MVPRSAWDLTILGWTGRGHPKHYYEPFKNIGAFVQKKDYEALKIFANGGRIA